MCYLGFRVLFSSMSTKIWASSSGACGLSQSSCINKTTSLQHDLASHSWWNNQTNWGSSLKCNRTLERSILKKSHTYVDRDRCLWMPVLPTDNCVFTWWGFKQGVLAPCSIYKWKIQTGVYNAFMVPQASQFGSTPSKQWAPTRAQNCTKLKTSTIHFLVKMLVYIPLFVNLHSLVSYSCNACQ